MILSYTKLFPSQRSCTVAYVLVRYLPFLGTTYMYTASSKKHLVAIAVKIVPTNSVSTAYDGTWRQYWSKGLLLCGEFSPYYATRLIRRASQRDPGSRKERLYHAVKNVFTFCTLSSTLHTIIEYYRAKNAVSSNTSRDSSFLV